MANSKVVAIVGTGGSNHISDILCRAFKESEGEPAIPTYLQPARSADFYERVEAAAKRYSEAAGAAAQSIKRFDQVQCGTDK